MDCGHFAADTQGYLGLLAEPCTLENGLEPILEKKMLWLRLVKGKGI